MHRTSIDPPQSKWNVSGARPVLKGAASLDGYDFTGWSPSVAKTVPASDVTSASGQGQLPKLKKCR